MEKEFAPYEESLKLKELGFDEPCLGLYREDGSFLYADVFSFREPYSPSEFKEGVDEGVCYINSEILEELVTVPTFSQAFRWFREKYNLVSWVKRRGDFVKEYSWYISDFNIDDPDDYTYDLHIETYEEAELACLRKLIEIVKNNL